MFDHLLTERDLEQAHGDAQSFLFGDSNDKAIVQLSTRCVDTEVGRVVRLVCTDVHGRNHRLVLSETDLRALTELLETRPAPDSVQRLGAAKTGSEATQETVSGVSRSIHHGGPIPLDERQELSEPTIWSAESTPLPLPTPSEFDQWLSAWDEPSADERSTTHQAA